MIEQNAWYDVAVFKKALDERLASVDSVEYFNDPNHQWLRDAWIAGAFARHLVARKIRLATKGEWPDFEVELCDGSRMACEATEADLPGRRRGDEYHEWERAKYGLRHDPSVDWETRRDAIPRALDLAVSRKLAKHYPPGVAALVIYLNLGTYDTWREDIERKIVTHTEPALRCFPSIWVLWSARLYKCWPGGVPLVVSADPAEMSSVASPPPS